MKNNQNKPVLGSLAGTNGKFRTLGTPSAERALARKQNRELVEALSPKHTQMFAGFTAYESDRLQAQLAADEEAQALQDHFPYTLLAHDRYNEVDAARLKSDQKKHKA